LWGGHRRSPSPKKKDHARSGHHISRRDLGTLTKIRHLTEWTKVDVPAIIDEKTFGRVAQRSAWQRAGANGRTGSSERVRVARKRIAARQAAAQAISNSAWTPPPSS